MGYQDYSIAEPKRKGEAPNPYKVCPECQAEVLIFAQVCPCCGYEFVGEGEGEEDAPDDVADAELAEFVDKLTREKIAYIRRVRRAAWQEKRSPDAPIEAFTQKYRHVPPAEWLRHACLTRRVSHARKHEFLEYLESSYRGQNKWATAWLEYHLMLEFGTSDFSVLFERDWRAVLSVPYAASWGAVKQAYIAKLKTLTEADRELAEELNAALEDAASEVSPTEISA
jgi:hypothetical protein